MKAEDFARKLGYLGGLVGVIIALIFAVLPGTFAGGWIGLKVASSIFGTPIESTLTVKLIMVAFMIWGLLSASIVFIAGSSIAGILVGYLISFIVLRKGGMQKAG